MGDQINLKMLLESQGLDCELYHAAQVKALGKRAAVTPDKPVGLGPAQVIA